MSDTAIEWTNKTWNPVTGCTKVSPGCAHCYAERVTLRFKRGGPFLPGKTTIRLHHDRLDQPLKWRKPAKVFVNSMSDLFHEEVPFEFVEQVWDTMFDCLFKRPGHIFQILTKRPERMLEFAKWMNDVQLRRVDYENIWLGVSVENQYWADARIPLLLQTPAAVRFLSVEPLLKPVDLRVHLAGYCPAHDFPGGFCLPRTHKGVQHINWVIVGGESGPRARPMHPDWVRSIRDQCEEAGVAFFLKQWGGVKPGGDALLDGREYRNWPQQPQEAKA